MNVTEIGNRIKKRRSALNMTQKDLAKEMNVSNQLISKWETGESVPSLEYLDGLCKALKVDYSYFTSDSVNGEETPEAVQHAKPKRRRGFKWNRKLFIIITASVLAAAFIAGFTVLTIYVFVPSANRKNYSKEIEAAYEKYFERGYYSINAKSELDGDVKDDYRYDGYFDEGGNPVFYDTQSQRVVKDGVLTFENGDTKYRYVHDKTYETLEEMALDKVYPDGDDDELGLISRNEEADIRYIRKIKDGYYLEIKDEFFTDELSGTQKKNYKLTDKIKGRIEIKDGLISSMKVTVKYLDKPKNERFTISAVIDFIAEKPVIEHRDLDGREWNGTYVGDTWYPPDSPDSPEIPEPPDTTPKCEDLLDVKGFINRFGGINARLLEKNFDFSEVVLNDELKYGGDSYYFVDGVTVEILNKTDLPSTATILLSSSTDSVTNVYVYNDDIYYTDYVSPYYGGSGYFKVRNVHDKTSVNLFPYYESGYDTITYNGKYAIYYGRSPDAYSNAYNVIDLSKRKVVYSYTDINIDYKFMDSEGNVYCEEKINGSYVPVVYKNGTRTILKGKEFYSTSVGFKSETYIDGDSICTYRNDSVYRYENGELKETLTTSDARFKENYAKLSNGYCFIDTGDIYDENGEKREFGTFKLKDENGKWHTVYDYGFKKIIAAINGKLIVSTAYIGGYYAVYDETDLSKPIGYMAKPEKYKDYCGFDEIELRRVGPGAIVAVRINSVDYYGYELYYFYPL